MTIRHQREPKDSLGSVLARPPIRRADIFDREDQERLSRELREEAIEIASVLQSLERLKGNPKHTELRVSTLIELWWRSYDDLFIEMDAELGGAKKDVLYAQLLERRRAWGKIQASAKRALADGRRRGAL